MTQTIRRFKLSETFIDQYKDRTVPWGPVGYITCKRTYARRLDEFEPGATGTEEWWQTCRRVIEGMFNMQKQHVVGLDLEWNDAKAQRTAKEAYERLFMLKWTPPGRGLWMMGTKFVEERTAAGLFNCFDGNTPFHIYSHTDHNDLVTFKQIGENNTVVVPVISDTGMLSYRSGICKTYGKQDLYDITFRHNQGKSQYRFGYKATANHRWLLADGTETTSLSVGDIVQINPVETNLTEEYNEGFAHGLIFGDGYQHNQYPNRQMIRLCSDRDKAQLTRLESLSFHRSTVYCESNDGDPFVTMVLDPSSKCQSWKELPATKNPSYLRGFIEGWMCADAWEKPSGTMCLDTQSAEATEWVKLWAPFAGYTVRGHSTDSRATNFGPRKNPLNRITLAKEPSTYKVESVEFSHKDTVWCLEVDDDAKFTLAGGLVTGNCAFRSTKEISTKGGYLFAWMMDALMVGIGVGFDTLGAGTCTILEPGSTSAGVSLQNTNSFCHNTYTRQDDQWTCIIADTREGWVESVRILLDAFYQGTALPDFNYDLVRPAGEPIKGFGGTASGPGPLIDLHKNLIALYTPKIDQLIDSLTIVDTENLIGKCVVAGNVRRSAALAMGLQGDDQYLKMKDPTELHSMEAELFKLKEDERFAKEKLEAMSDEMKSFGPFSGVDIRPAGRMVQLQELINNHPLRTHRWGSNNSIVATVGMDYAKYADQSRANGEPGYIWLDNARYYGRMKDPMRYDDLAVMGFNPCVEQQLEDAELCCLTETYPAKHDSYEDYQRTLKIAYLYAKTVTLARTQWAETNAKMQKNRRIGLSQSGVQQARKKFGYRVLMDWCNDGYDFIQNLDRTYSDWLCIPRSKRTTSIKPSGTVSLLNGSTPGIHYAEDEYYIRRIRFAEDNDMIPALRAAGYPIEKDSYSDRTLVVSFPVQEQGFTKGKRQASMWEQLEMAAAYQANWADNSVSVTVTFKEDEAPFIQDALEMYESKLKAVSFLRYSENGYVQAPYEAITAEQYNAMSALITPITSINTNTAGKGTVFCTTDQCLVSFDQPSEKQQEEA
jgi:ribonucleotide reductase alpha subunit